MTREHEHDDPVTADPVMDWALGERLGGEQPPDLVGAVRARLHEAPAPAPRARLQAPQLAAAALVLLGVAVVCSVALWPKPADVPAAPWQEPKPVHVDMSTDVASLPAHTKAIEASYIHDVKFAELARFRELEVLILRDPANESFGLSPKVARGREHWLLTAEIWSQIATWSKLRRLELSGIVGAAWFGVYPKGVEGGERVTETFAQLERLPLLESLTLRFLDTPDEMLAVLPRLHTLRHLDLSFNHGFGVEGVRTIAQCRGLRTLSLRGCQQLRGDEIALLAGLLDLEEVDLSAIDGINWRSLSGVATGAASMTEIEGLLLEQRSRWEARWAGRAGGFGPDDATLEALASLPRLRVLSISGGNVFSGAGLAALGRCASLRELNASGLRSGASDWVHSLPRGLERLEVCGDHGDGFCVAVAQHLTSLRDLTLAACDRVTDAGVRAVAAMPSLRRLDLRQMRGLTAATIDALAAASQLEEIDLRHDDFVTTEHVVRLHAALPNLRSLQTSVSETELKRVTSIESGTLFGTVRQIEALPASTRFVHGVFVDDACLAALTRLSKLEEIALSRFFLSKRPQSAITGAGLLHLAKLPSLRRLALHREEGLAPALFAILPELRALRELSLIGMTVTDEDLAKLDAVQLHELSLVDCTGFGRSGLDAIARSSSLRLLAIQHADPGFVRALRPLRSLREMELTWPGPVPTEIAEDLRAMPWLESVTLRTVEPIAGELLDALRALPLKQFTHERLPR